MAFVIKRVAMGGEGVKSVQNWLTSFKDDPLINAFHFAFEKFVKHRSTFPFFLAVFVAKHFQR